jgi:chemotaxis protein MotA
MDLASFVGIISGMSLIVVAILMGGDIHNFINIPGFMIVVGGTIAATLLTFQFADVLSAFKAAGIVFSHKTEDANDMIETMLDITEISRKQGIVALSKVEIESALLKKACDLIADGSKENMIKDTLMIEIMSMKQRHYVIQEVFKKMGLYAPAFGMIGTLIGLIQMLSKLSDPESVGPSMAVALITTLYGTILASMIFNPIAGKLKARTLTEVMNLEIIFEGAISILENNNPRLVYEKLSSYIPKKLRRPMQNKMLNK